MRDEARAVDTADAFFSFLTILQKGNKRKKTKKACSSVAEIMRDIQLNLIVKYVARNKWLWRHR